MLKNSILIVLFVFLFVLQGCNSGDKQRKKTPPVNNNEYLLSSLGNKKFKVVKVKDGFEIKNIKEKIVIFDIFATWCPPCQRAASHLSALQKKYKDDVIIVGISIEDNISSEKLKEFRKVYGANYTLLNSPKNRLLLDKIVDSLGLGNRSPIPIIAIYKDGKYITHYIGSVEEEFIESDIKRALGK